MFTSKVVTAAEHINEGMTWGRALRGLTVSDVKQVAVLFESEGNDEQAQNMREAAYRMSGTRGTK